MTKAELKSQFQNSYNRESWMPILKLVFGQINFFSNPFPLFEGEEAVKQGCQIGYVDLPNNQTVAIFEIEVADSIIIERNRKGLRDIAAKYIKGTFSAALVFYYSKNQTEYRFSFIAQQSKIDEQTGDFNTVVTAPKRYTYILGTPFCATAAERWIKLATENEITVDKITDAFSVEKLSKEFFDQYKIQYTRFCKFIEGDAAILPQFIDRTESDSVKAQKPLRDYVKKLLGRLVFLQFLQKKGWMGVPATYKDWNGGDLNFMANLFDKSPYQDNFLDAVLEPLFFNTLNAERTNDIAVDIDNNIKIPYLNGGLFEKTSLDNTKVQFPKHYFCELFEFFNQYNFTIDENDPDDAEVGIDPEMLGHIFENLLEDNKDKGAFYTPKEIVRYMCQESLIAYLHTHTPEALHPSIEKLIRSHKVDDCLQDKPNATLIQKLLAKVKICDPAIGSGAFPMGMLNEIFMVRRLLFGFLGKNESFSACLVKKEIIQNNIYGVDIEQGAVDIARLRFWLALVVDEDVPQALPNLDYKIMCGNSLISRFPLDAPIKDVFAEYNKKNNTKFTLQDYKNLVDEYTDIHNAKEQFRAKIEEIKSAFKSELLKSDLDDRKKIEAKVLDYETIGVFGERKADKDKKGYKKAKEKLEKFLKFERDTQGNIHYLNGFEWRFEWPSLLDEKGNFIGFDIVIANPPYIGEKGNERIFQNVWNTSLGKRFYTRWMDYFYFFFHIGIDYLKENGCLIIISTNYFFTSTGGHKLRKDIFERTSIASLVNFNELTIFESATGQHNVITKLIKCKNKSLIAENFDVLKRGTADSDILKLILSKNDKETKYYKVDQEAIFEGDDYQIRLQGKGQINNISKSVNDVLRKMDFNTSPLGSITNITMGIVSLSDTLSDNHLKKYKIDGKKGDGIYVINSHELKTLGLSIQEEQVFIKPFFKNSDIQKYISKKHNNLWLIYCKDKGKPISLPIGLENHFNKFKELIVGLKSNFLKNEIAASVVKKWFENGNYFVLFTPKKEVYFDNEKIVAPYRSKSNNFALSSSPFYGSKDIAFILPKDSNYNLKYLVCILNSNLIYKWLYFKGKRKGEMLELYTKPLASIPIRKLFDQRLFTTLHDNIVMRKELKQDTVDLEQQIDTLVYKLYELSYEEVLLIEPDFGQRVSVEEYEAVNVE